MTEVIKKQPQGGEVYKKTPEEKEALKKAKAAYKQMLKNNVRKT